MSSRYEFTMPNSQCLVGTPYVAWVPLWVGEWASPILSTSLPRQLCGQSPAPHQGHRPMGLLWASIHKQTLVLAFGRIPLWDISFGEPQPINTTLCCPEIMLQWYQMAGLLLAPTVPAPCCYGLQS